MKRFGFAAILILTGFLVQAQQETIRRLRSELSMETGDTIKIRTLDSLSMYYLFFTHRSDSASYYANEAINLAFNLKNKKYLILAYARMGFYYINTAQYKAALDISLRGIKLSELYRIPDYLSALYYNNSWVFYNLADSAAALRNAFESVKYLNENQDPFYDQPLHVYGIIGNIYADYKRADSAFYFFSIADSLGAFSKELAAWDIVNYGWSMYYGSIHDYAKADSFILAGIASCEKNGDFLLNVFHLFLCQSYLQQGKLDSAILAGHHALEISRWVDDQAGTSSSAYLLQSAYDKKGNSDSAYFYLRMGDSLRSVIASKGSANEIQQIRFDDQIGKREEEVKQSIQNEKNRNQTLTYIFLTAFLFFLIITGILWRNNKQRKKTNSQLHHQNIEIENALKDLKTTQSQLIQSEKMASLGELTAGIAHEIQNPLNFVNNFSEVNAELIEELKKELLEGNTHEAIEIIKDIRDNEQKITHHGKRADGIVKGMLLHSQGSAGKKESIDINILVDESLRLAYHGIRAKDKSFNVALKTDFDEAITRIQVVPQDMSRVLVNLYNNAFYAMADKKRLTEYDPSLLVMTKKLNGKIEIRIKDNGNGIPKELLDKIFQPFFTTKPTGQGTGLGLSLSYDIIKGHGGEITVNTQTGEFTEFIIQIPV